MKKIIKGLAGNILFICFLQQCFKLKNFMRKLKMLGYMTAKEAKKNGFTHHGSYYGIPLWMNDDEETPMICTKFLPFEYVMSVFHFIEGFINAVFYSEYEPSFMFMKGKLIDE